MSMTPGEFDALPPDRWVKGYRYEVIKGVLVVSPPAGPDERSPDDDLSSLLRSYKETHPRGSVLDATLPEQTIFATSNRRRTARVIWIGLGRIPKDESDVPAIIVECVSARDRDVLRDYETKRDEYLAAGVQEYWVIDRFRRIMAVYRKGPFGPIHDIVAESRTYQTELLPGFVLPLARLLAQADDWRKARCRCPAPGQGTE